MKKLKSIKVLLAMILAGTAAVCCCSGFARNTVEYIEALYSDIKIYVNGNEMTPVDVNGNAVEPFTYNETTYLPVRAVADALGYDVNWDEATNSVIIGANPSTRTYLTDLAFSSMYPSDGVEFIHGEFPKIAFSLNIRENKPEPTAEAQNDSVQLRINKVFKPSDDEVVFSTPAEIVAVNERSYFYCNGVDIEYRDLSFNRFTCTLLPPKTDKNITLDYSISVMGKDGIHQSYKLIPSSKPVYVDIPCVDGTSVSLYVTIHNASNFNEEIYLPAYIEEPAIWR